MPTLTASESATDTENNSNASQRLRTTMAATRVSFTWLGVRKTLSPAQKAQAADQFDAAAKFLSATKKLLDTVQASLDGLMVDRPRRSILRPARREEA